MREILFRGKRIDNGEWVEGYYSYAHNDYNSEKHFIQDKITGIRIEVNPETVNQYTNIKDKNGKKIFEGDIVGESWQGFYEINNILVAEIPNTIVNFIVGRDYKIIGNIYDNPELWRGNYK